MRMYMRKGVGSRPTAKRRTNDDRESDGLDAASWEADTL